MNTFFTADLHLSHDAILKHCNRPWSIEEHNDALIARWNAIVSKRDTVYVLGDMMMVRAQPDGTPRMKIYRRLRHRLNGSIILIKGNHDAGSSEYYDCFTKVYDFGAEVKIDGEKIVLCHYPMRSWNRSFHGSFHAFGHLHGRLEGVDTGVSCDVGVDVPEWDYKPVAWEVLRAKLLKKREIWKNKYQKI